MDFQLLLIYSRVNCCTARGLAVGVGAEPRRPSGRPAVHVVQRLSWLLHLPGAGFRMLSRTCRGSSTVSPKEETKAGFPPLPAPPGTRAACRSCAGPERGHRRNGDLPLSLGPLLGLGPGAPHTRTGCFPLICLT